MSELPPCPQCNSPYSYEDGELLVCPECAHEWTAGAAGAADESVLNVVDSRGTALKDGDSVQLVRDLNVKGSNLNLKQGTAAKNIRLTHKQDEVECRFGKQTIVLKTQYLKKA